MRNYTSKIILFLKTLTPTWKRKHFRVFVFLETTESIEWNYKNEPRNQSSNEIRIKLLIFGLLSEHEIYSF